MVLMVHTASLVSNAAGSFLIRVEIPDLKALADNLALAFLR